jgi:hypothetical protein
VRNGLAHAVDIRGVRHITRFCTDYSCYSTHRCLRFSFPAKSRESALLETCFRILRQGFSRAVIGT